MICAGRKTKSKHTTIRIREPCGTAFGEGVARYIDDDVYALSMRLNSLRLPLRRRCVCGARMSFCHPCEPCESSPKNIRIPNFECTFQNLRESVSRLIIRVIISLPRRGCVAYDCVTKNALWRTLSFHFFFARSFSSFIIMHKNFTSSPVIMTLAMQFFTLAFVPCCTYTRYALFPPSIIRDRFFAFFSFFTMRKKWGRRRSKKLARES